MRRSKVLSLATILLLVHAGRASAVEEFKFLVTLKKAWVKKFANRATVDASMTVRHSHHKANPVDKGGDDGDMHFSGESDDVGLPFVAEVVNAAKQGAAKTLILSHEDSNSALDVTGAWRLWFEHPSTSQVQGGNNAFSPDHTNPDHSFEIHPVSKVGTKNVVGSIVDVEGYTAYTADVAITYFEGQEIDVKGSASGITIRSKKLKYNYVELEAELVKKPTKVSDGYIALATIFGKGDEQLTPRARRLIFVEGTKAADEVKSMGSGDRLKVLAIPRIDLNAVVTLVAENGTKQVRASLPYEMIVVGTRD